MKKIKDFSEIYSSYKSNMPNKDTAPEDCEDISMDVSVYASNEKVTESLKQESSVTRNQPVRVQDRNHAAGQKDS
jgi:hypothetical protein